MAHEIRLKGNVVRIHHGTTWGTAGAVWTVEITGQGEIPSLGPVVLEQDYREEQMGKLRAHIADLEAKLEAARKALGSK